MDAATGHVLVAWTSSSFGHGCGDSGCAGGSCHRAGTDAATVVFWWHGCYHRAGMDAVTVDVLVSWMLSSCRHGRGDSGCAGSMDVLSCWHGCKKAVARRHGCKKAAAQPQCLQPRSHTFTSRNPRAKTSKWLKQCVCRRLQATPEC